MVPLPSPPPHDGHGPGTDATVVRKLQAAIRSGGVVVASSVAVKSVMLKFLEARGGSGECP